MNIDDLTFFRFTNNLLSKNDMANTAKSLRESGEMDAALQASVVGYEANRELANGMLGADVEYENNEKSQLDNDRIVMDAYSKKANNINNKTMTANINLTKDEQQYVLSIIENFNSSAINAEDISFDDKFVKFYMEQRPGSFPEDAYKIVGEMRHGIEQFNANLKKILSESGFDYAEELHKLAADMPLMDKYELYANFLAALQTISIDNLSADQLALMENFQTVRSRLEVTGEVSDDMIVELETKIAEMLNNNTLCLGSVNQLRHLVDELPKGTDAVEQATHDAEEDMRHKLIASMATYIAWQNDRIASMHGKEFTAEAIAIATAAGVEQAYVISVLHAGRTTVDRAIHILKIIGGVALFTTLAYFALMAMIAVNTIVVALITNMIGTSVIAALGSLAVIAILSIGMGEVFYEVSTRVMSIASRTFDLIVDTWRKTAWPVLSEVLTGVWLWINEKITGNILSRHEQSSENVVQTALG